MLKVYAAIPGATLSIGPQPATDTVPAIVPDELADSLVLDAAMGLIRIEPDGGSKVRLAWHSKAEGTEVYHDNSACSVGNNIERHNLEAGTGKLKRCAQCAGSGRKAAEKKE